MAQAQTFVVDAVVVDAVVVDDDRMGQPPAAAPAQPAPVAQPPAMAQPAQPLPVTMGMAVAQGVPMGAPAQQQMYPITYGFGDSPQFVTCQYCHSQETTKVLHYMSGGTHIVALGLCVCTGCCCCLPYLLPQCQGAKHFCPKCNQWVGHKSFITDS
eukprot:CAMPEP_0204357804 /NCGR_PEP_ID=MMETSP0469-20131031/36040_1 /ASSEMBLY_ACC=CAM_ASM_000384 /TAXON_ID=2969 /ORGANISM="Oxyrrhis marina" /LENGTH=155 /DNA_ID=CAMNT_0051345545 /DNA_START=28 /DNA_END=495 /DNA_ORIENTATION=-